MGVWLLVVGLYWGGTIPVGGAVLVGMAPVGGAVLIDTDDGDVVSCGHTVSLPVGSGLLKWCGL